MDIDIYNGHLKKSYMRMQMSSEPAILEGYSMHPDSTPLDDALIDNIKSYGISVTVVCPPPHKK